LGIVPQPLAILTKGMVILNGSEDEARKELCKKVLDLTSKLNQWRDEYYNLNVPTVTDAIYDRHFDELRRLENEAGFSMSNSPTRTVGYEVVKGLEKTVHDIPLLSLEKTKQTSELLSFISSHQALLMHKLDGLTVKLEYENGTLVRASTRGNGEEGEVIAHNARAIDGIPMKIPYTHRLVVVGEAFIPKQTFDKLRETLRDGMGNQYRNSRNMAAGSVRCHDARVCSERGVVFSPFSVIEGLDEDKQTSESKSLKLNALEQMGFSPCERLLLNGIPTEFALSNTITVMKSLAEEKGIPIDGIVASYDNIPYSVSCGRTGHHYKDGIAFKFGDDLFETVFRGIEWNPSRSGELSPVALFDTVEMDGCEVSKASLHNLTFIKELELAPGCRILVSKRNMIIPHVEENLDRKRFDSEALFPKNCPCCGGQTRIRESRKDENRIVQTLRCENPNCAAQNLRKFVHFVCKKSMNIDGLSEATLEKFINRGWLRNFTDIYRLDEHEREIVRMEGFGEKSWQRLWDAIQRSRNTTFERFVISMDIPMIGRTASKELSGYFNGDLNALKNAVENGFDFRILTDFGDVLHRNIYEWFENKENLNLWEELQKMLNIGNKDSTGVTKARSNPFAGKTVAVTGKLTYFTRDAVNARIEELGAKAGSSVSRNTDYLICGEKAGSKLDKARALGITVLTEREFLDIAKSA
jgi:DNA ligase (NAD+)